MKQWKRITFYLLLNVLVSACTTFLVLSLWDRTHSPASGSRLPLAIRLPGSQKATPTAAAQETPVPQPTPTQTFVAYQVVSGDTFESIAAQFNVSISELIAVNGFTKDQPLGAGEVLRIPARPSGNVEIDSVAGAGDLASERVLLKHAGEGELSLAGWVLEDEAGNLFVFPQLTLFSGAVNVWTGAGSNTVVDLYWGLDNPVWTSGETVTLKDDQGKVRDTYTVP